MTQMMGENADISENAEESHPWTHSLIKSDSTETQLYYFADIFAAY